MRHRPIALAAAALLLGLAACSDDGSDGVTAGSAVGPDSTPVTTAGSTTDGPATTNPATTGTGDPGSTATPTTATSTDDIPTPSLVWSDCGAGSQCATLSVPVDYSDPTQGTMQLTVARTPASNPDKRIGSLLVNPGGPGYGGASLALSAFIFSDSLREHFDIVGWDPRGTGSSTPAIDCIDDYDPYYALDITPDDAADQQVLEQQAAAFAAACASRSGDVLAHVSTLDTARDMDLLRRALGEDKISYFGFSYGSELGATWATMFPDTVRAAVLDGAADPNAESMQGAIDQAKGFEIALNSFLARCAGTCAFAQGGDPAAAFDAIMADIDSHAYPTVEGRPALNSGIAYYGVIKALYSQSYWPLLDQALDQARQGNGAGLLDFYDNYYERNPDGSYGNELEAFIAISCLDDPGPATVAEVDSYNATIAQVAPRVGPLFSRSYACVGWPVPAAPRITVNGKGAGPIVVIGTTNDSATPFESSMAMAAALEGGVFVKVVGEGHTGYQQSVCAQGLVDAYLVDLEPPADDTECN